MSDYVAAVPPSEPTEVSHLINTALCSADAALRRALDAWLVHGFSDQGAVAGDDLVAARLLIAAARQSTVAGDTGTGKRLA